jgi:hypothetical protein
LSPTSAAEHVAEATEQVRQVGEVGAHAGPTTRRGAGAEESTRAFIVLPPLLGVREDLISVLNLLKALLGLRVLPVGIRVVLTG